MAESRSILKSAVEVAQLGLAELDPAGRFVAVNSAYLTMLGMKEADLLGKHWSITAHQDDHQRIQEAYELARTTGGGYVEIQGLRQDSSIVYQALTVEGTTNDQGVFTGYQCLRHDMSRQKHERDMLMLAVESAPSGLLLTNSVGQIQFANHAVEKLFGYGAVELLGRSVEFLLPERFRERHVQYREEFTSNKGTSAMAGRDLLGLRKDGVEIPLQLHVNRIESSVGDSILVTVIDISERIRCQRELEVAKQTAEFANRAKSDFLARMSHEIRTPMGLIMGMNTLLLEGTLDEKQRRHVEISHRNVRRLLRLINGILDLSKVESRELTLEALPFDLDDILGQCKATLGTGIAAKGLGFEISSDVNTWRFWLGDPERLQQVLLNLIGNALKFTAQGRIDVKVGPEIGVSGARGLRFEVADTGCGVPPEQAEVIFEAFQQAKGTMDLPYEGTGLGLSISKTLVEKMGGKIWLEEKAGPGSKFVFTVFPQPTEEGVQIKVGATVSGKGEQTVGSGSRVLLVEDNDDNVILMQAYLENLSLSLDRAVNGVEALAKRQNGDYDLVLMDMQMPVMDGYTATREIRAWEKTGGERRVPIVAVTAHALSQEAAECLAAGCDGYLSKPVERSELVKTIVTFSRSQSA